MGITLHPYAADQRSDALARRVDLLLEILVQSQLPAMLGGPKKDVRVVELAAEMFCNQAGLAHGVERAERAGVAECGMAGAVPELK